MTSELILVSRKDACRMLGISIRTLDSLVRRGEIRVRRIGSRVLFERRSLEAFSRRDHRTQQANKGDAASREDMTLAKGIDNAIR
jgi:excisionase family DNA binding protein